LTADDIYLVLRTDMYAVIAERSLYTFVYCYSSSCISEGRGG